MTIGRANKYIVALMLTGAVALGTSGIVYAAASGSTPNGRPFVEINGQIAEVKNDISALQAAHDAIVARVDALEGDFQAKIDLLNAEIARLDAENDQRIAEIQDLTAIAEQNGFDIAFALSELLRLEAELDSLAAEQADQYALIQDQIAVLEADIAANAAGLLGTIADVQQNSDLIGLLQSDLAALAAEVAGKQDDIGADCPAGFFVYGVRDDGTLDCAEDSAAATPTFITSSSGNVDLDNTSVTVCIVEVLGVCLVYETTYYSGDKYVSVSCPSGYQMTGGGFGTGVQDDIVIEDSRPSGNGWTTYFDNRNSGDTSGRYGYTVVRCMQLN